MRRGESLWADVQAPFLLTRLTVCSFKSALTTVVKESRWRCSSLRGQDAPTLWQTVPAFRVQIRR